MIQTYFTEMPNMECRKVTPLINPWTDEKGVEHESKKLEVSFDTAECDRVVLYDKNMENESKYQRGTIGKVVLRITTESTVKNDKNGRPYSAEKTTIFIEDFVTKKGGK